MSLKKLANMVKKEQKEHNKTPEELFTAVLDNFLISRDNKRSGRLAFNPSSYYKCARLQFYKLTGQPPRKKKYARSERILDVGTQLHEWVQTQVLMKLDEQENSAIKLIPLEELPTYGIEGIEWIKEHNAPPTEVKFVDSRWTRKFPVSAMVDGAFTFMAKDILFEFKTINPDDYNKIIEPLKDHLKQGAIYCLGTGIRYVMFLYLNKGNQEWKAYLVEYRQEQLDWVVARITTIEDYVLRGELPPKEEGDNCKYCEFKYLCDEDLKEPKKK